jgi:hypothetical protein
MAVRYRGAGKIRLCFYSLSAAARGGNLHPFQLVRAQLFMCGDFLTARLYRAASANFPGEHYKLN